jgi:hypothetical protein
MGRKRKIDSIKFDDNNNDYNKIVLNSYGNEIDKEECCEGTSNYNILNGQQRNAANDRERTRMRVLSKAFVRLKTSLPWVPSDTKLSKLDTLKLASSYILYLTNILNDDKALTTLSKDDNFISAQYSTTNKFVTNIKSSTINEFITTYSSTINLNTPYSHHLQQQQQQQQQQQYQQHNTANHHLNYQNNFVIILLKSSFLFRKTIKFCLFVLVLAIGK